MNADEFRECRECAAKPGSPALCESCLHNRALIDRLSKARKEPPRIVPLRAAERIELRELMGAKVAQMRIRLGLSQRELARRMIRSASWVREIEHGEQFAPAYLLKALARASATLEERKGEPVSVGWFYGEG